MPVPEMGADCRLDGRRVLVVEDEFLIASDLADAIRRQGGDVVGPCADPESAWDVLSRRGERIDAAVLDLNLRGRPVVDLAWELARHGVALVYHTGYDSTPEEEGLPDGPVTTKPASHATIVRHLVTALERIAGNR